MEVYVNPITLRVLYVLSIAVVFGVTIGAIYALVLPAFFPGPGWGTYLPLQLGIVIAALIGGYIGYRVPTASSLWAKIGCGFCYAAVVAILVSFLSLLIIVNTRGE
jgi:hypothetical protein